MTRIFITIAAAALAFIPSAHAHKQSRPTTVQCMKSPESSRPDLVVFRCLSSADNGAVYGIARVLRPDLVVFRCLSSLLGPPEIL